MILEYDLPLQVLTLSSLDDSYLGPEGGRALAEALGTNTTLTKLQ